MLSTLSNELFDVYCHYKEAKEIWKNMIVKNTVEDAGKQKFVIENYYRWTMKEDKDIKIQINEYHKLLEDLKIEKIVRRICCGAIDWEIARILEQLQEPIEA